MNYSGYHDCPCRDCFEISIGGLFNEDRSECDDTQPGLCHDCEDAGCDPTGESDCESPNAYGGTEAD